MLNARAIKKLIKFKQGSLTMSLLFCIFAFKVNAETPGEEAARVQRQLEEQRLETVHPTEITIDQYRRQMELEKRLRTQQQQIDLMENQLEQLRSGSNNESE